MVLLLLLLLLLLIKAVLQFSTEADDKKVLIINYY
jgi:hypothetical protein